MEPQQQTASFGEIDRIVEQLPYPIARMWANARACTADAESIVWYVWTFEVTLRTMLALLLPDYLRGEPVEAVEQHWRYLVEKPSRGHYLSLLKAVTSAIRQRSLPRPFMREAAEWCWGDEGKPRQTLALDRVDEFLTKRNIHEHTVPPSAGPPNAVRGDLEELLKGILRSLDWLAKYRMMYVSTSEKSFGAANSYRATVHILAGSNHTPAARRVVLGEALPTLPKGLVFLTNKVGDQLLCLAPFAMMVSGQPNTDAPPSAAAGRGQSTHWSCHVFKLIEPTLERGPRSKKAVDEDTGRLVLTDDGQASRATVTLPIGVPGSVPFMEWLTTRSARTESAVFPTGTNRDLRYIDHPNSYKARDFKKGAEIGRGGFATVFRATMLRSDRQVAYKLLERIEEYERFENEVEILRTLSHPNIVPFLGWGHEDSGEAKGQPFLVMELMGNGTLSDQLARGRLPYEKVLRWGTELLDALVEVHDSGIAHRDIKPSNCLLNRDDRVFLADFGIARNGGASGTHSKFHCTLDFASPEQRARISSGNSHRPIGPPSDLYSLGVTLHLLITGNNPASPDGVGAVGDGVPPPLADLLRRMCQEDSEARPTAKNAYAEMRVMLDQHRAPRLHAEPDVGQDLAKLVRELAGITKPFVRSRKRRAIVKEAFSVRDADVAVAQCSEWLSEAPEDVFLWDSIEEHSKDNNLGPRFCASITRLLAGDGVPWSVTLCDRVVDFTGITFTDVSAVVESARRWQAEMPTAADRRAALDRLCKRFGLPAPEWKTPDDLLLERLSLVESEGRWNDVLHTLQGRAEGATDKEVQISSWSRIAVISITHLGDANRALRAWERVLALDAAHREAQDGLTACLFSLRSWDQLEAVMRRRGRLAELADQYEVLARRDETPAEVRLRLWLRAATFVQVDLRMPARAACFLGLASSLRPTDPTVRQRQLECLRLAQDWHQLARVLEATPPGVIGDRAGLCALWLELANVQIERLGDRVKGAQTLERIAGADPSNEGILTRLDTLYEASGDWARLANVLARRVRHCTHATAKAALLERLGVLQSENLKLEDEAVRTAETLFALEPTSLWAAAALDRAYERGAAWEKLLTHRRRSAVQSTPEERAARWAATAMVADERFPAQLPLGIELWGHVLRAEPTHSAALLRLEDLYRKAKIPSRLVAVLTARVGHAPSIEEKVAALHRLAEAYRDDLQDVERANYSWASILELAPSDQVAQDGVRDGFIRQHDLRGLRTFLTIHGRIAEFGPTLARAASSAALPSEQRASALVSLGEYQRESKDWRGLASTLAQLIAWPGAGPEQLASRRLELADVQHTYLGSTADALHTVSTLLMSDPHNREANDLRERIEAHAAARHLSDVRTTIQRGDWAGADRVAALLSSSMERVPPALRAEAWRLIGQVRLALNRSLDAIEAYEQAQRLKPDDLASLDALLALYRTQESWDNTAGILERLSDLAPSPQAKAAYLLLLGDVHREKRHRTDPALIAYTQALLAYPINQAPLDAALSLVGAPADAGRRRDYLSSLLKQIEGLGGAGSLTDRIRALVMASKAEVFAPGVPPPQRAGPISRPPTAPTTPPRSQGPMSLDALRSRLKAEPRDPELLAELHRRFKAVGRMDAARCAAATARYLKRSIKVEADPPAPLVLEHPGVEGVPVPRWLPGHWAQMTRALHPKLTPILSTLLDADRLSQGFQQRGKKVVPANAPPSRLEVFRSARWLADALYGDSVVLSQTSSGNKTIDFSPCALDGSEVGARLFAYPLKGRTFVLARHLAYHHASLRPRVDLTANSSLIQLFSRCVDEASKALLTQATPLRPTTNSTPPVPRATMASLKALVREHPNLNADLDRWREAADRVALDVAFTFIGDLGLAHLMLDVPFGLSSSLSSGDLSTELVRFSVSEEYFSL